MSTSLRLDSLRTAGVEFVAGVPCSFLAKFFAACDELPAAAMLRATREDHAVAACAGAWFAGRLPLAAMQNSGLGYCLEALSSLHLMYALPLPMLVSDRGHPEDYEEHRFLGARTRRLLELFEIPWREAREGAEGNDAEWLVGVAVAARKPAALLVGRGADT